MATNAEDQGLQKRVPELDETLWIGVLVEIRGEVSRIPAEDGKVLLQNLLDAVSDIHMELMLEYLFDHIVRLLGTDCYLRLQEKCQDARSFRSLIRKIQINCEGEFGEDSLDSLRCSSQQWSAFVAIIEGLEEQEPDLVVSTLDKELPQLELMSSYLDKRWLAWLRILCLRLLREDRNLVRCKGLKYFLTHLSVEQLDRFQLLPEFVVATNRSQLFDPEDDICLTYKELGQFVGDGSGELLLEALVAVSWESVPLLHWLLGLEPELVESVPKELFIKLCLTVRALKNDILRGRAQNQIVSIFKNTLESLSLRDYMSCMVSLLNKNDTFCLHSELILKIKNCTDFEKHLDCFNRTSFEILLNFGNGNDLSQEWIDRTLIAFISRVQSVPKDKHGFWRLFLYTHKAEFMDFYTKIYNVDISLLQKGSSIDEMKGHLLDKLDCQNTEERVFVTARCVDLFIRNLKSWSQLEELNLDPLELLKQGTDNTITGLVKLLETHNQRLGLKKLFQGQQPYTHWKTKEYCLIILRNARFKLTQKIEDKSMLPNLYLKLSLLLAGRQFDSTVFLKTLLRVETTSNTNRIEAAVVYKIMNACEFKTGLLKIATEFILHNNKKEIGFEIFERLLRINEELSIESPYYLENSKVHIQKMRIASALIDFHKYCGYLSMESLLLSNDQLGINILHEILVGNVAKNIDWALEGLASMQPRQQESYLSVVHIFILKNWKKLAEKKYLPKIFASLLPLTMGSSYETRTLAQLILHNLAVKFEERSITIPLAVDLKNCVEALLGEKLFELQHLELRLYLPELPLDTVIGSSAILYMTNAPLDEIVHNFEEYEHFRQAFRERKLLSSAEAAPSDKHSEGVYL